MKFTVIENLTPALLLKNLSIYQRKCRDCCEAGKRRYQSCGSVFDANTGCNIDRMFETFNGVGEVVDACVGTTSY